MKYIQRCEQRQWNIYKDVNIANFKDEFIETYPYMGFSCQFSWLCLNHCSVNSFLSDLYTNMWNRWCCFTRKRYNVTITRNDTFDHWAPKFQFVPMSQNYNLLGPWWHKFWYLKREFGYKGHTQNFKISPVQAQNSGTVYPRKHNEMLVQHPNIAEIDKKRKCCMWG